MNTTTTTQTGQTTQTESTAADRREPTTTADRTTGHTSEPTTTGTDGDLDIPTRPPEPETRSTGTLRPSSGCCRRRRLDDEIEYGSTTLRRPPLTDGATIATDGGRADSTGLDALPPAIHERVDRVVETAAERFDLRPEQTNGEYGQFRTRWTDCGFDGIDEFAVTLREQHRN